MDDVLILGYLEKCWVAWLLTDMYRVAPQQNIAWNTAYARQLVSNAHDGGVYLTVYRMRRGLSNGTRERSGGS